jgi:hypothetical protein
MDRSIGNVRGPTGVKEMLPLSIKLEIDGRGNPTPTTIAGQRMEVEQIRLPDGQFGTLIAIDQKEVIVEHKTLG